jgi:WD40 repeat protein
MLSKSRPVIFVAFANPEGDLGSLKAEFHQVKKTLEQLHSFELVVEPFATKEILLQTFQKYRSRITIFHYGGHADQFGILLESGKGTQEFAATQGLAEFLSVQTGLQLVFLNGCSTDGQVKSFHRAGVPVVIGTRKPIPDTEASTFAAWFYQGLATGATLEQAFTEAKGALKTKPSGGPTRGRDVLSTQTKETGDPKTLWNLYARTTTDRQWSLTKASGNPLFGLPQPQHYDLPRNPFRPLSRFREQDWEIFFGRGQQIRDLYNWVLDKHTHPILLLFGQSGVGKSSLLDAGLNPRLKAAGYEVRYVQRDRSKGLYSTLKQAVMPEASLAQKLREMETKNPRPVMVILDQIEEAYTYAESPKALQEEMEAFVEELAAIYADRDQRPQGKLILSFRKEWLAEIEAALEGKVLFSKMAPLEPLDHQGILEAINGPAHTEGLKDEYNLTIADGLAEKIANDLLDRNSPIAPTLQLVLTKMWDKALSQTGTPHFDFDHYEEFHHKDLGDILDQQLDKLRQLKPEETDSGLALDVLAFHTTRHGTAEQHNPEDLLHEYGVERAEKVSSLIQACKDLHLLADPSFTGKYPPRSPAAGSLFQSSIQVGAVGFAGSYSQNQSGGLLLKASRLSHDTLAPYVRERFDSSMLPGQRARRILEDKVKDWEEGSSALSLQDLQRVEHGQIGMRTLRAKEAELLKASKYHQDQITQAIQREQQRQKTLARNLTWAKWIAIAMTLIALAVVEWQRRVAVEREVEAVSRQLVLQSSSERQDNRLLMLLQAFKLKPSVTSLGGFLNGLMSVDPRFKKMVVTPAPISAVEISPKGDIMAFSNDDGTVGLLEVSTGQLMSKLPKRHHYPVYTMDFSLDGRLLVTGGDDGIQLWNTKTRQPLGPLLDTNGETVVSVKFSPDQRFFVSGSYEGTIQFWDVVHTKPIMGRTIKQVDEVETLQFSPNGRILAASSDDNNIQLWNVATLNPIGSALSGHKAPVSNLGFSPDGQWLVSGSNDTTLRIWAIPSGKPAGDPLRGHTAPIYDIAISSDGKTLASGSVDGSVRLWSLTQREPLGDPMRGHNNVIRGVMFDPTGAVLISASNDKSIQYWNVSQLKAGDLFGETGELIHKVLFDSNGQNLVSTGANQIIRIWDLQLGKPTRSVKLDEPAHALALSEDNQLLAIGGENGVITLSNFSDGKTIHKLEDHTDEIGSLVFNSDHTRLFSAGMDSGIRVWDTRSGQLLGVMGDNEVAVHTLKLSSDDNLLLSGSADKTIQMWDTRKLTPIGEPLHGHEGEVLDIAISPDGKQFATSGDEGSILLWDFASKNSIGSPLTGLGGSVYQIAYSADGQMLMAGNEDGTVQLWDIKSRQPIGNPLQGHSEPVTTMAYNPKTQVLATGSRDTTIRLWDVNPKSWVKQACKLVGRNFLPEEWAQYLGEQFPYQPTCPEFPLSN